MEWLGDEQPDNRRAEPPHGMLLLAAWKDNPESPPCPTSEIICCADWDAVLMRLKEYCDLLDKPAELTQQKSGTNIAAIVQDISERFVLAMHAVWT